MILGTSPQALKPTAKSERRFNTEELIKTAANHNSVVSVRDAASLLGKPDH